jgi:hypothetical protein
MIKNVKYNIKAIRRTEIETQEDADCDEIKYSVGCREQIADESRNEKCKKCDYGKKKLAEKKRFSKGGLLMADVSGDEKISNSEANSDRDKILNFCSHKEKERVMSEKFDFHTALRENVFSKKDSTCLKCMNCVCQKKHTKDFSCNNCYYAESCMKKNCLMILMRLPEDRTKISIADLFCESHFICSQCNERNACSTSQ